MIKFYIFYKTLKHKKKISKSNISVFKVTRANILAKQKRYSKSIRILEKLLQQKNIKQNSTNYARILSNLGLIKFQENPLNIESEALLLKALEIRKERKYSAGIMNSHIHLSKYYNRKNLTKSLHHAREGYKNALITKNQESIFEALDLITALDTNSIEAHQHFKKASVELMELRNKTREIYAPTRFENESLLKENEEKNTQITQKEQQIAKVESQNTIYLLGMLLLCAFIGFVIYFSKQRTKYLAQQNKIVQFQAAYETETRISKRLHDELGNDIFQVMLQYQNDPHDTQILEKLNTSYTKARDISRENSEFETDESFAEELTDMLQNYAQQNIQLIQRGLDTIHWDTKDTTIKITTYRVLQELMTNMQKHSQASLVAIVFANGDKKLRIKYSDNGIGIDQEQHLSKNGLRNTEKRIAAIGGTIVFDSEKDKGFKAEITIPV